VRFADIELLFNLNFVLRIDLAFDSFRLGLCVLVLVNALSSHTVQCFMCVLANLVCLSVFGLLVYLFDCLFVCFCEPVM
jgi:hypothetical protein